MRTKFKFLIAAAVLAVGFSSCSNADDVDGIANGEDASLKITIPAVKSYADPNATAAELKFTSADVFVYNGGALETHKTLSSSDFNSTANGYEMKAPMIIKSGQKNIFVGLNLSSTDVDGIKNGGLNGSYLLGADYATILNKIAGANGNAMFSTNSTINNSFTIKANETTSIAVVVERWAAKITTRVVSGINEEASGAKINSFTFAMGNVNTVTYPLQKLLASGIIEDANWDWSAKNDAEFAADAKTTFVNEFGTNSAINTAAYVDVDAEGTAVLSRKVKYASENTTKLKRQGDVTYISVRAKFEPKAYHSYDGTSVTVIASPSSVPADLYVTETATGEVYYFPNKTEAENHAKFLNSTDPYVGHYKNGLCYYFVWLDPKDESVENPYGTIRNFFYDSRITKVNSLGYPDPEEPNPTDPLPEDSQLSVEVDILDWVSVSTDSELGKI